MTGLANLCVLATSALAVAGCVSRPATGVYDVRAFGATGDGVTKDTAAIQAAIDAAGAAGGGEVRVPAGRYVTGTLYLRSNVDFNVTAGATVEASRDPADYNKWDFCPQNNRSVPENHEGGHLFVCLEQTNVVLRGAGTIDGNGVYFMSHGYDESRVGRRTGMNGLGGFNPQDAIKWRPAQMIYFVECDRVALRGLEITDAPYWSVFIHGCTHVTAKDLYIHTSRQPHVFNGDGLNFDCCRHVDVSGCRIDTADDSLCLRARGRRLLHSPSETAFVTVSNCTLSSSAEAIRIGVGSGKVHDCRFSNIVIRDSGRGINMSSTWFPEHGVDFADISFADIVSETRKSFLRIHRLKSTDSDIRRIRFDRVRGKQGEPSYIWSRKGKPFADIVLRDVEMDNGIEAVNVDGFRIEGGTLKELVLSPEEREQRSADIESFRKLLW